MKRTPQQNTRLHQLLTTCRLMDDKADLVRAYTGSRTGSSSEMTEAECRALIQHLELIEVQMPRPRHPEQEDPADRQRKKIISMAHEMRWTLPGGRADMARIQRWCLEKSYGHKRLNDFTLEELPRLVSQFKIVYEKHLADLAAGR